MRVRGISLRLATLGLLLSSCSKKSEEVFGTLSPQPLPKISRVRPEAASSNLGPEDSTYRVVEIENYGEMPPGNAARLQVHDASVSLNHRNFNPQGVESEALRVEVAKAGAVILYFDLNVYFAQTTALLATLADAGVDVWIQAPTASVAYSVTLRDEPGFRTWLDEARPGKVRVIQRADGFEVQTNMGKLAGADRNGPSIPIRGGKFDVATLRQSLQTVKGRFPEAPDACLVPSYGMEWTSIATALNGFYRAPKQKLFPELCLVFPRPRQK